MVKHAAGWGRHVPGITRDGVLFVSGLLIIWHEVLRGGPVERPGLLVLAAGMVGLPAVIRGSGAVGRNGNGGNGKDQGGEAP